MDGGRALRHLALGLGAILLASAVPPPLAKGAAALGPVAPSPAAAEPPTQLISLRFGSPQSISDAGIFVGRDRGYYREQGFEVEVLPFQSGPNTIAPLASGDLELAGGTVSIALLNAIDRGIGIKAVADKGASRVGFEYSQVPVRPELLSSGEVRGIADLRGRRLAVAGLRTGAESLVAQTLARGGLSISDVELVELGYPEMLLAMGNGAIDGGNIIEPTLSAAFARGVAGFWEEGRSSTAYGGVYQAATLVVSSRFLAQPEQLRRFLVAYLRGVRAYNDAFVKNEGRADVVRILTEQTTVKDPAAYERMNMAGLDPDGQIARASLQRDLDYFRRMGYYSGSLTVDDLVDTTYVDWAAEQLGPYR